MNKKIFFAADNDQKDNNDDDSPLLSEAVDDFRIFKDVGSKSVKQTAEAEKAKNVLEGKEKGE